MLEKLGLPAKPSNRGANWVVDASHCQGCSSQFTFINRKHHCRRCGGLFCNSCTQQRMVLRGQGDSPVRICEPCKKIEDAARFELRHGHKNRAAKGSLKHIQKQEEIAGQLAADGKQPLLVGYESHTGVVPDLQKTMSNASCSNLMGDSGTSVKEVAISRSLSAEAPNSSPLDEIASCSPEDLRKQAVEEKKKYRLLKGEGKPGEALQAFKRGKELERQAGALEIALRKGRKMALKASDFSMGASTQQNDHNEELNSKKLPSRRGNDGDIDLASELRDLGWSDADIHDEDKKPAKMTLEGELSNLLGDMPRKRTSGLDKSQVIAHKKKALVLKRDGKLAEAKEELRKAKVLEKQLEEQELLGEAEDSDDELSALIHSMDDEKQDDMLIDHATDPDADFGRLLGVANDFSVDGNFEVTDDDMNDPELAAALKSFGWSDEEDAHEVNSVLQSADSDMETQVLALKKEALSQKQAGNVAEALALLRKAKQIAKDLESVQSVAQTSKPGTMQRTPIPSVSTQSSVVTTASDGNVMEMKSSNAKKSKLMIQRELLTLKKKALALRREGRVEEAEEELKKGKVLEKQLEEMENTSRTPAVEVGKQNLEASRIHDADAGTLNIIDDGMETEVTEGDMHDPALLSVLKNLGWSEDDNVEPASMTTKTSKQTNQQFSNDSVPLVVPPKVLRSKTEIQRELLGIKRGALALRRKGKAKEADEELERAKPLENKLAEMENATSMEMESNSDGSFIPQQKLDAPKAPSNISEADVDLSSAIMSRIPNDEELAPSEAPSGNSSSSLSVDEPFKFKPRMGSEHTVSSLAQSAQLPTIKDVPSVSDSVIVHSSSENLMQEEKSNINVISPVNVSMQSAIQVNAKVNTTHEDEILSYGMSSTWIIDKPETKATSSNPSVVTEGNLVHDFDDQKAEILNHKRKALALKREGKLEEAREELRRAKILEKSLEDTQQAVVSTEKAPVSTSDSSPVMQDGRTNHAQKPVSARDRFKLQQESLSHKRNALKLRREGKTAEAEAEFELAKALENQLEELDNQGSSAKTSPGKSAAVDDALVEDLLDPQLMSALKSIGWADSELDTQFSNKSEPKSNTDKDGSSQIEKIKLEEQIKTEKLRALHLKRAGKSAEALEALRSAKKLEKKLELLSP